MKSTWAYVVAILWTLFIATSCFLPASTFKAFSWTSLFEIDKFIHLFIFYWFVVFWLLIYRPKPSLKAKFLVTIIGIAYGVFVELIQSTATIGRSYETMDVIADTIGAILGVLTIEFVIKSLPLVKKYLPFMRKVY